MEQRQKCTLILQSEISCCEIGIKTVATPVKRGLTISQDALRKDDFQTPKLVPSPLTEQTTFTKFHFWEQ